jgi:hypothetical protein
VKPVERDDLRALVRDVIREALAEKKRTGGLPVPPAMVERVRISSDDDLKAFVRRIVGLMRDPATAERIEQGSLRFSLAGSSGAVGTPAVSAGRSGLVNERTVDGLEEGTILRLAAGAVVTPLARDRARQRGITLERVR